VDELMRPNKSGKYGRAETVYKKVLKAIENIDEIAF